MSRLSQRAVGWWISLGPRFLPFADAASPTLPLSRLLRLSLFQVAVGMVLVLLVGTLNRVMIVELGVSATLVAVMVALPLLLAPARAVIGFRSDVHRSELGWRRVPFLYRGAMLIFGGLAIMPFAVLVLAGEGESARVPALVGPFSAAIAFLLTGAGVHTVQTAGLALATDLAEPEARPKVVGLLYVMLLLGMVAAALVFGALLADFSPGRLVQVIQGTAVASLLLVFVAVWKQEARSARYRPTGAPAADRFADAWARYAAGTDAVRALVVVAVGTLGFGMAEVLLEPYGGQILDLSVSATTLLTAALAGGTFLGFWAASLILKGGADPFRMAMSGALVGVPAFAAVLVAGLWQAPALFVAGTFLAGIGAGLFGHGTLTATIEAAPRHEAGLALGAWGAAQSTAAGVGLAAGGILRDAAIAAGAGPAAGYHLVYGLEILLLLVTLLVASPRLRGSDPQALHGRNV
jgi:BCD family chlorophyll transporter-like MFS transporter